MLCAALLLVSGPLPAQTRTTIRAAAPVHAAPDGARVGTLQPGAGITLGATRGAWREVELGGWIWSASTGPASRPGFDLAVTASEGEILRTAPDGDPVARLLIGTQLSRLEKKGGWTRVRRTAWVPTSALAPPAAVPPAPTPGKQVETARPIPVAPSQAEKPPLAAPDTLERVAIRKGAELAVGPGSPVIGASPEQVPAWVTARSGNWVRVRTELWVRGEDVQPLADSSAITLDRLRADPDKFVGQPVAWRLQFLSLQVADELRPELPAGQPYVLARGPLPEAGFVYLIVTAEQAARFRQMNPLDEFTASAVIRAPRTRYLPTPVLELRGQP